MSNQFVDPETVSIKFKSKADLYKLMTVDSKNTYPLTIIVGFFLPNYKHCSVYFIKQILAKDKYVS